MNAKFLPRIAAWTLVAAVAGQIWAYAAPATSAKKGTYAGSERCSACHMVEHRTWKETPHARALETLENAEPKAVQAMAAKLKLKPKGHPAASDDCLKCHVTGFKLPSGYPHPDSAKNASLASVGCETCHGPGSRHITAAMAEKKSTIVRKDESVCVTCHVPAVSPDWKYEDYASRGVHPKPSEP